MMMVSTCGLGSGLLPRFFRARYYRRQKQDEEQLLPQAISNQPQEQQAAAQAVVTSDPLLAGNELRTQRQLDQERHLRDIFGKITEEVRAFSDRLLADPSWDPSNAESMKLYTMCYDFLMFEHLWTFSRSHRSQLLVDLFVSVLKVELSRERAVMDEGRLTSNGEEDRTQQMIADFRKYTSCIRRGFLYLENSYMHQYVSTPSLLAAARLVYAEDFIVPEIQVRLNALPQGTSDEAVARCIMNNSIYFYQKGCLDSESWSRLMGNRLLRPALGTMHLMNLGDVFFIRLRTFLLLSDNRAGVPFGMLPMDIIPRVQQTLGLGRLH